MILNKTLALALHRAMWTDMQTELGDNPSPRQRANFKDEWIKEHFPNECVMHNCFLCEYAFKGANHSCCACPIRWPGGHCSHPNFSYCTAPIGDILALPEKNKKLTGLADVTYDSYYKFREEQIAKASGIPASSSIGDHIKAIKEKAVEEYFEKSPGTKLATMDADEAFKQYADEQKAPIFRALAEASGLSAGNGSVKAHISSIRDMAKQKGRIERSTEIFKELAKASGLPEEKRCVSDHIKAIQERAKKQDVALSETYRKSSMLLVDTLNKYKDFLSDESGLDRNRPVADHIHEIVKNSMEAGAAEERDRIQEKIYKVLLS